MLATVSATEALSIVAISSGFVGALATVLAVSFRHQFIAERKELNRIRENTKRMMFMSDSLADGQQMLRQLVDFNLASIHELYELVDPTIDLDDVLDSVRIIQRRADRGLHELLLLSPRRSDRVSGAHHVSQDSGGRRAQQILHWLISLEDDEQLRRLLKDASDMLETRLDSEEIAW